MPYPSQIVREAWRHDAALSTDLMPIAAPVPVFSLVDRRHDFLLCVIFFRGRRLVASLSLSILRFLLVISQRAVLFPLASHALNALFSPVFLSFFFCRYSLSTTSMPTFSFTFSLKSKN